MTDMHREAFEREFCRFPFDFYADRNADDDYKVESMRSRWEGWCAALRYRDEQEQTSVWRCYKEYMSGDGGRVHSEKFAKTKADMLIFKSQGYDCEKLSDEQEKQA
jgi:hypothetical protein